MPSSDLGVTECMIFKRYFWPLEWAFGFGMALALRVLALGSSVQSFVCTQVACPIPLCVRSLVYVCVCVAGGVGAGLWSPLRGQNSGKGTCTGNCQGCKMSPGL